MKLKLSALLLFLTVYSNLIIGQKEFEKGNSDKLRIENEIKLAVPDAIVEKVWEYLQKKYDNNNLYLKKVDSTFNTKLAEDIFIDQYFDNKDFLLLKNQNGVRHRKRQVLTDTSDKKNGKELMQIKINGFDGNELNRAEYKYPVKHYENKKDDLDSHPFLGLVKRKKRDNITERLAEYEIDAESLFPTILITQNRRRIYVYLDTNAFATLTLDRVTGDYQGEHTEFVELELELNENNYTDSDAATRAKMEKLNEEIKADILSHFPEITQDQTPKYNKAANLLGLNKSVFLSPLFFAIYIIIALVLAILYILKSRKK